jgi:hypothetical protein
VEVCKILYVKQEPIIQARISDLKIEILGLAIYPLSVIDLLYLLVYYTISTA